MSEEECLQAIQEGRTALELLEEAMPNIERRWRRLCRSMHQFMSDVEQHFPDATYYTASGGFNLLLGRSHNDNESPQHGLTALSDATGLVIGDGDW